MTNLVRTCFICGKVNSSPGNVFHAFETKGKYILVSLCSVQCISEFKKLLGEDYE